MLTTGGSEARKNNLSADALYEQLRKGNGTSHAFFFYNFPQFADLVTGSTWDSWSKLRGKIDRRCQSDCHQVSLGSLQEVAFLVGCAPKWPPGLPVPDHADGAINGNADGDANADANAEVRNEWDAFLVTRGDQYIAHLWNYVYLKYLSKIAWFIWSTTAYDTTDYMNLNRAAWHWIDTARPKSRLMEQFPSSPCEASFRACISRNGIAMP